MVIPRLTPEMLGKPKPTWLDELKTETPETALRLPQASQRTMPTETVLPQVASRAEVKEKPIEVPFWQRSLQIFAAPFQWVDENVIKPSLSLLTTTTGLIPEVQRMPGEDFFEWKKRSWSGWKSPGMDINVSWSKDPLRFDLKGVMEFAPWLLLPGAGQVGGGIRAARGVAGILGKMGQTGRILGYGIEYSPWGVVDKTVGATIKAGVKGITKGAEKVSTKVGEKVFGKIPEPSVSPTVQKFTTFFKESVVPARAAFEKELPALRVRQAKAVDDIWKRVRSGEITATEGTALAEKATAGGIKSGFATKAGQFAPDEVEELLGQIVKSTEKGLVARDSNIALRELALHGTLPEPHHIRDFALVFGEQFAKSVKELSTIPLSAREKLVDAFNLPRAVLASTDISGVGRQGLILSLVHPTKVPKSFVRMFRALFSERLALQADDIMRTDPLFKEFVDTAGGYIAPLRKGAKLAAREETFMSSFAEKIPLVRRSERAFITYLNELRFGSYKAARDSWVAQGAGETELKVLGSFINLSSGRGDLPANLNRYAPLLNTVLFSPRLQMSMLQLPRQLGRMLLSKNPYMRKEAAKALVTFLGGGTALLMLLKGSGVAKVEFDPRSSDFGKIKIGETRLDIWRGYAQYARFLAQVLTSERKSAFGNMNKAKRDEIVWRFMQSKSSPAFGLMIDLLRGETYIGDEVFKDTNSLIRMARERLLPLALQDTMDAIEQSGVNGAWTAIPATLGIGTLTYINDFVRAKEKIAKQMGYKTWDEIDPKTQRELENSSAELQAAYLEFDRQVMGTAWGDWRLAGKSVDDVFRENIAKAVAQFRITGDGVQFREKVGDAFTARRGGYAAREKEPRFEDIVRRLNTKDTAEALVGLGPEQLAIRAYNDALYGDDMYDEFGDYRFDEAEVRKAQLQQQLGVDLYDYVEEYQGLKFADLPPEFQELAKAKIALKPYWNVQRDVEKIYGKPQTPARQRRVDRVVQRIRQRMRRSDSEVARYYTLFYSRTQT